ncbi:MFS transporter [Bacteroidota bacterium]
MNKSSDQSPAIQSLEKRTFTLHLISQFFHGIAFGTLLLQDIILKKSLFASDFEITLLVFLTSSAFLFSIYGVEMINRSNNPAKTIIIMAATSKVFLLFVPFFEDAVFFIFCIAIMSYIDSMIRPTWNAVYKHNYTEENRSKLYSYSSSMYTIVLLIVITIFGQLLDVDYKVYKIFYPLAGITDFVSLYILAKLVSTGNNGYLKKIKFFSSSISFRLIKDVLMLPVRNLMRIFKDNKSFFRFERNFFFYGMALMIASPAIPIYLVQELKFDYSPISIAKGLAFHVAMIIFTPLMGRMHGSGKPAKFCGYIFSSLVLYPVLLIFIKYLDNGFLFISNDMMLFITFFIFGISMSGVILSWNLSSIYYAPAAEVSNYQAIHITLTGIRGIFSPFIGFAIMKLFSISVTFVVSALLFLFAGIMMFLESRRKD